MQQRNAQLQRRDPNHPPIGGPINAMNSEGMIGQPGKGKSVHFISILNLTIMTLSRVQKPQTADDEDMDPTLYFENRLKALAAQKSVGINCYPHKLVLLLAGFFDVLLGAAASLEE
ncbi:hypothetical protein U1Q18_007100 [Sarracenia purpurea var. burkii]